jgi:hypothetical protein
VAETNIPQPMDAAGEFAVYTNKEQGKEWIMMKKSDAAKANKSHKSRSPKGGHAERSGGEARPNKAEGHREKKRETRPSADNNKAQPDKAEDRRKKDREIRPSSGNDKAFDDVEKLVSGKKSKDGCLPKVLMMFLLFSVVGTYFYLSL